MDVIDRKINLMEQAGVKFVVNAHIGVDINAQQLRQEFDAVLLTGGSTVPRDLSIPGRDLKGVYFAMQFLAQNNRRANGMDLKGEEIHAKGKHVVVIGGGDTGSTVSAPLTATALRVSLKWRSCRSHRKSAQ